MFRDARVLDQQRTAASFNKVWERYSADAEKWFDGSVGSIDRRLAQCDKLLHSARFSTGRLTITSARRYLGAVAELESDRRTLTALREDLLTGSSNRADVVGPRGWRTASKNATAPQLEGSDRRWVELESSKFLAANQDTLDDSHELAIRAANHAEVKTSTYPVPRSRAVTAAFVAKVTELGQAAYRPPQRTASSVYVGFDDSAVFL